MNKSFWQIILAAGVIVIAGQFLTPPTKILAQNCPRGTVSAIRVEDGFLSLTDQNKVGNYALPTPTFSCITGNTASIPQFSLPTYQEMKSLYYTQSKISSSYKTEFTGSITETQSGGGNYPLTGYSGVTINQDIQAESGTLNNNGSNRFQQTNGTPTYIAHNNNVSLPSYGGRAAYSIYIPSPGGDYQIIATVNTTATTSNTFTIDFENDPLGTTSKAWDTTSTGGAFADRVVSWRGTGTEGAPQYPNKTFTLSPGNRNLYIRGIDSNARIDKIKVVPVSGGGSSPTPLQVTDPYRLFKITGDLTISTPCLFLNNNDQPGCSGDKASAAVVIMVDGNLIINNDITYGSTSRAGIIFIVGGDVRIASSVTQINGVIITSGQFCTAYNFSLNTCDLTTTTSALTINGSVIALDSTKPPRFVRNLSGGNATPAESITYQPKYVVAFRDIFARSLTIWNEVQ